MSAISISQPVQPTQLGLIAYNNSLVIPTAYRNPNAFIALGREPSNSGAQAAAEAGALIGPYLNIHSFNASGTYMGYLYGTGSGSPAFTQYPRGGATFGGVLYPPVDLITNTEACADKVEATFRRIKSQQPWVTALFLDEWGPNWVGYLGTRGGGLSGGEKESFYQANVTISQRARAVADEFGWFLMTNGEWRADTNFGYPTRSAWGCSLMDGFCVEHHAAGELPFWRDTVGNGQWRLRDAQGQRCLFVLANDATQLEAYKNQKNMAWITLQTTPQYTASSITPPSGVGTHSLGISGTTTPPTVTVAVSPLSATVQVSTTRQFTATVSSGATPIWKVNGVVGGNSTVGTITTSGLYTAPSAVPTAGVSVSATAPTGESGSASVTVQTATAPPPGPTIPPVPAPGPLADGNRFIGSSVNTGMSADLSRGMQTVFEQGGTITRVSALIDGLATGGSGSQPFRYVIYADTLGEAGALLAVTADGSVAAGAAPAWVPLTLTAPLVVAAGTVLHLHIHSGLNVVGRYYFTENGDVSRSFTDTFIGGALDPAPAASMGDADISIYFDFEAAVGVDAWDADTTPVGGTASKKHAAIEGDILAVTGKRLSASATWNPASVADGAFTSTTVTVAGATIGMPVDVGFSVAVPAGAQLTANVTATNTVTVTLMNHTGGALDLASGSLRVDVRKT